MDDITEPIPALRDGVAEASDITKPTNAKDVAAALAGRVPMHLFPMTALIEGNLGFLEGALKYGAYNYRVGGVQATVYFSAMMRHMVAWLNGEDIDPKSRLNHVTKAMCCCAVLIDAINGGHLKDDRPVAGPEAEMLEEYTDHVRWLVESFPDPVAPFLATDYPVAEEAEEPETQSPPVHYYVEGTTIQAIAGAHVFDDGRYAIQLHEGGWIMVDEKEGQRIFGDPKGVMLTRGTRLPFGGTLEEG